ncbi:MAG: hypothetical protein QXQ28_05865 [Candidatus Nezhaarchaeales archaeon]
MAEKDGWVRRFVADEPRLSEAVKLYESLGYEVKLEPVTPNELSEVCGSCVMAECGRYRVIYTRPKKEKQNVKDELEDLY